jgi:hypothetical protein
MRSETITFSCDPVYGNILRRWSAESELSVSAVIRLLIMENTPSKLEQMSLMEWEFVPLKTTMNMEA